MPQAKPAQRRPWDKISFRVDHINEPVTLPKDHVPTHWYWHLQAPEYTVALSIEAHLLAEVRTTGEGTVCSMHQVSLMPDRPPKIHKGKKLKPQAPFFEFHPGDYLQGHFELPSQVLRAEVRVMFIGATRPSLIIERVKQDAD